jgi:aconitate decarboxylase
VTAVTPAFCDLVVRFGADDLDSAAIKAGKRLLIDGIAVAVAGSSEETVAILLAHYAAQGTAPVATAIGGGTKLGLSAAAAVNGAAMHVLDFEPMWSPSNHALSTSLPAILALAEQENASGLDVLTALAKACEIQGWIREASRQYEPRKITFHPPGVVGPLGAAVGAAHLLKLDGTQLAHALGMTASRASGLSANIGTMTKCTHCGNAAAAGLDAALLARRGFTANETIFDTPLGYVDGFFKEEFHREDLLKFGRPLRMLDPGFALKMYPSQYGTHFAITAALGIAAQLKASDRIASVLIEGPVMPYVDRPRPATGLEGKFSMQYTAALALLDGAVGIDSFSDARLGRPDMQALLPRISYRMAADIPAQFEKMHVTVTAELADGRRVETRCDGPPGIWGAPAITDEAHARKVADCLTSRMHKREAEELIALADNADRLEPADLRRLITLSGCFTDSERTTKPARRAQAGEKQYV